MQSPRAVILGGKKLVIVYQWYSKQSYSNQEINITSGNQKRAETMGG